MAEVGDSRIRAILSFVGSLFGLFSGRVSGAVKRALTGLRSAVIGIGEASANYMRENNALFARVVGALRRFYTAGIVPLLRWLRAKILELRTWLKRTLGPVLRILQRLRKEWRIFRARFIQPILDFLSAARVALRILRTLHVGWAKKLDEKLATVESWIYDAVRAVETRLTKAENVIDRVITFDFLLQRFALIRSLDRDAGFWIRVWWNKSVIGLTPAQTAALKARPYPVAAPADAKRELTAWYRTGSGDLAPRIRELLPLWRAAARGESTAGF